MDSRISGFPQIHRSGHHILIMMLFNLATIMSKSSCYCWSCHRNSVQWEPMKSVGMLWQLVILLVCLKGYVETARGHDHHPICRPLYALGWMLACFQSVSRMLASIMTGSSCCFPKCNEKSEHRNCIPVCPGFGQIVK